MRASHLLLTLAAGTIVLHFWRSAVLAGDLAERTNPNGFVTIPLPTGVDPDDLVIFAPLHCPKAAGRRADRLEQELDRQGIPHRRSQHADFAQIGHGDAGLVQSVMGGEIPIVFVNGRAKANPSPDEVVAEYSAREAH